MSIDLVSLDSILLIGGKVFWTALPSLAKRKFVLKNTVTLMLRVSRARHALALLAGVWIPVSVEVLVPQIQEHLVEGVTVGTLI